MKAEKSLRIANVIFLPLGPHNSGWSGEGMLAVLRRLLAFVQYGETHYSTHNLLNYMYSIISLLTTVNTRTVIA